MDPKLLGFFDIYKRENMRDSHPMGMLQTLVAGLSLCHPEAHATLQSYKSQDERDVHIHRVIGQMPTIAAACLRVY